MAPLPVNIPYLICRFIRPGGFLLRLWQTSPTWRQAPLFLIGLGLIFVLICCNIESMLHWWYTEYVP